MNKEELWYVVEDFTNIRIQSKDAAVIYGNYTIASKRAEDMSTNPDYRYVPIRVSEYHKIYG